MLSMESLAAESTADDPAMRVSGFAAARPASPTAGEDSPPFEASVTEGLIEVSDTPNGLSRLSKGTQVPAGSHTG